MSVGPITGPGSDPYDIYTEPPPPPKPTDDPNNPQSPSNVLKNVKEIVDPLGTGDDPDNKPGDGNSH